MHPVAAGTLLYLLERQVPVERTTCLPDASAARSRLAGACPAGNRLQLPAAHDLESGAWVWGVPAIWEWVEQQLPEAPDLGRPQAELSGGEVMLGEVTPGAAVLTAGSSSLSRSSGGGSGDGSAGDIGGIEPVVSPERPLGALLELLRVRVSSGDEEEMIEAEARLKATLFALEDWLAEHEMAFIGGDQPNATDCYLIPELVQVFAAAGDALRHLDIDGQFPRLARYCDEWSIRDSWHLAGWSCRWQAQGQAHPDTQGQGLGQAQVEAGGMGEEEQEPWWGQAAFRDVATSS